MMSKKATKKWDNVKKAKMLRSSWLFSQNYRYIVRDIMQSYICLGIDLNVMSKNDKANKPSFPGYLLQTNGFPMA